MVLCHWIQSPRAKPELKKNAAGTAEAADAFAAAITDRALALIRGTPPDGREFALGLRALLRTEEFWTEWKKAGCKPYEKEAAAGAAGGAAAARKRRRLTSAGGRVAARRAAQGIKVSPDTARLWESLAPVVPPPSSSSSSSAVSRKRKRGEEVANGGGGGGGGGGGESKKKGDGGSAALFRAYPHLKLALPTAAPASAGLYRSSSLI